MANIIITQVTVNGLYGRMPDQEYKAKTEQGLPSRRQTGISPLPVGKSAEDDPEDSDDDACPEKDGNFADGLDIAVQEQHDQDHQRAGDDLLSPEAQGYQVVEILCEADSPGSHHQRGLQTSLPYEEERHQGTPFFAIGLFQ